MARRNVDDIDKQIGKMVSKLRLKAGMSQEDLAGQAEIDRSYLSEIENGHKNVSIGILKKLAKSLGVKVSVLIGE